MKNIEKITKVSVDSIQHSSAELCLCKADQSQSMKVVASTKLTRAERAMREAKKYGAANNGTSHHLFG